MLLFIASSLGRGFYFGHARNVWDFKQDYSNLQSFLQKTKLVSKIVE